MPESSIDVAHGELAALREENELLREHIAASERANAISRELVVKQFQEVERVLSLFEQENNLRKGILDAAHQLSIVYCDCAGTIRLFNRGAELLLGYDADETIGRKSIVDLHRAGELAALADGATPDLTLSALIAQVSRNRLAAREWTYLRHDGTEIPVKLSFSAVRDVNGEVVGLMCAAMDISEIKAANAQLQQKNRELGKLLGELQRTQQQLLHSEKMASLGQLAAGVAHEINNPIGFVNSNIGALGHYIEQLLGLVKTYEQAGTLIANDLAMAATVAHARARADIDFLEEDAPSLVQESLAGLKRVKKIVEDLRTFTRMGETSWAFANLNDALDSTLNVIAGELRNRATVERRYEPIPEVACVIAELNQVFMNLLCNAAQALDPPGTIRVATRARSTDEVEIEIADDGCGIDAEHLKHIFDPFFTTKPVGTGTGLGLSTAYGIVEKHRGRIEVESAPGVGSTFRVILPIRRTETQ